MSRLTQISVEHNACDICPAAPGEPCETITGARATRPHANRVRAAEAAWHVGHEAGIRFAVSLIESKCDPDKADLDPRGSLEHCLDILRRWAR